MRGMGPDHIRRGLMEFGGIKQPWKRGLGGGAKALAEAGCPEGAGDKAQAAD